MVVQEDRFQFAEVTPEWKCPKCGREFNRLNQDHYCIKPQNIDEYIAAQNKFAADLSEYDISKGTIRIPYDQPLPEELIGRIAQWCFEKYSG